MKLQNRATRNKVAILNILLLIGLATSIVFFFLRIEIRSYDIIVAAVCLVSLLCLNYLGAPFFKYDSNGETLIIQNEKALPFSLTREHSADFPKEKLTKFSINYHFLFKRTLEIYIKSRRGSHGRSKLSFNISYLDRKDVANLKISLNKMLHENNKVTIFDAPNEDNDVQKGTSGELKLNGST
ncbi:MAG: hypothetical protein LBT29_06555 [Flavobacteriaceae bacterium]|jgi:hypothetical protein|nr:hypothetical protein [Flavobacteriaceae bacterium]